ncbi:protein amnionless [Megalops cyprinoides]|uniref:protein amnionless n=1 Tax=Megalops cyprinoides TaxID=118141 RepID=UPI0018647199|nr:protein amnionless [Megalops cyprinoides]
MPAPSAILLSPCLLLALLGTAAGLYKQWVPDTNFENATNWDTGAVPCGSDTAGFSASGKVSVYVERAHVLRELALPEDGEFILAPGAGFAAGGQDAGCGTGVTAQFRHSEALRWFNPALWQAAASRDDLERGRFLFSVHEESVPCRQDDAVFRAAASFRVDVSADGPGVPVRSVSVLGQKFTDDTDFSRYLASRSGRLQFHGNARPIVGSPACGDSSGCECGNSAHRARICAAVTCPSADCGKPLRPAGHCCDVCGAIVRLKFADGFDLESYRQRLQHLFLSQPQYRAIRLALSKVARPQWLLGLIPRKAQAEIQVVLLNDETGAGSGPAAENLAREIMRDVQSQGEHLGIEGAELEASSGGGEGGGGAGVVVGAVLGVLALLAGLLLLSFLFRRGIVKAPSLPSLPSLPSWRKSSEIGELGGPLDHGFDNPMFDKPSQLATVSGLYGPDSLNSVTMTHAGVHFVNPAYDETDFNA